ncbi:Crp/Fnr family transcriptional regulator [Ruegeria pomeroyi]|uniref:Crp/Fnr family transcriptional regulator n=1 Tax=Ruegeria pomeroyi TaxID=89184 RepID=UPI001F8A4C78|nr:Crp/Fnr family transcriptional regulator [Ruegeria pomeroyi]
MRPTNRKTIPPLETVLMGVSLLAGLETEVLAEFADDLELVTVYTGQTVMEQGETSTEMYVVVRGRLVGLLLSPNGKEVAFTEITSGRYFGELSALDGRPRSLTISAAETTVLARMPAQRLLDWMAREPRLAHNLAIDLAERNRALTERVFGLVVHDVDKRVRALLIQQAQAAQQLKPGGVLDPSPTHDVIANYIGATREAVSRVMARLAAAGVIETGRRRLEIADIEQLFEGL